jgi:XTP/dITP diphosphohydrolase
MVIFATGNRHKFSEIKRIAEPMGLKVEMRDVPCNEIQSDRLEEIASCSAKEACGLLGEPCFVEDAGMFIAAMSGFPGPYSSYIHKTVGNRGILKLMTGEKNRRAFFISAIAYAEPRGYSKIFLGKVDGEIAKKEAGRAGFGFDPIFIPKGFTRTMAQMKIEEKNQISHRFRAFEKFARWFLKNRER